MPSPGDYNSKSDFMSACIPQVLDEGTAKNQDQAVAVCNSMWEERAMSDEQQTFTRYLEIERANDQPEVGEISGILATDGEASDGHIIDIDGLKVERGAPLLFGHNAFDQEGVIGSWSNFERADTQNSKRVRGFAKIEVGGEGKNADARADLAHMVAAGHIKSFSMRWDSVGKPVRRTELKRDHPAFIDAERTDFDDPRRWGFYFGKSRMVEGSIVPVGADPKALIGRMQDTTGDVKQFWRNAVEDLLLRCNVPVEIAEPLRKFHELVEQLRSEGIEDFATLLRLTGEQLDPRDLTSIDYDDGKRLLIPRAAYDVLMHGANERLELAFDLVNASRVEPAVELHQVQDEPDVVASEDASSEDDATPSQEDNDLATVRDAFVEDDDKLGVYKDGWTPDAEDPPSESSADVEDDNAAHDGNTGTYLQRLLEENAARQRERLRVVTRDALRGAITNRARRIGNE